MKTFYFNTGVKSWNNSYLAPGDVWIKNERHISFQCEGVPDGAAFLYIAPNDNTGENCLTFKIHNSEMEGYAYFSKPVPWYPINIKTLHLLIAIRGMREQAFAFACGKFKGGMKGCYTKGCEIFTPLQHAIKGVDVSEALYYDRIHNREFNRNNIK